MCCYVQVPTALCVCVCVRVCVRACVCVCDVFVPTSCVCICGGVAVVGPASGGDSPAVAQWRRSQQAGLQPEVVSIMSWSRHDTATLSTNLHGGALVANYPLDACDPKVGPLYIDILVCWLSFHISLLLSSSWGPATCKPLARLHVYLP
jgi:hypothetical protein